MRWTTDDKLVDDIVASYQDACRLKSVAYTQTISEALPDDSDELKTAAIIETKPSPETTRSGPSMDDVIKLQHNAWTQAAQKFDLTPPTIDEVYAASFMDPNKATASVFQWSLDANKLEPVVANFRASLKVLSRQWAETIQKQGNELLSGPSLEAKESLPFFLRKEGAKKWLKSLQNVHMPCVVVSYMSSEIVDVILREIGLSEFFPANKSISSSSGYELDMQQILGGALRAERRPDKCVLFSPTPQSAASAHDVKMKNVALVSPYPYYELRTADMTALGLGTIRITNMQNIFSDANTDEPMQELQVDSPEVRTRNVVKTKFRDEDGF